METMQHLSQKLDSLAEKVEGNDGRNSAKVTEPLLTSGSTPTLCVESVDRALDELLNSLSMTQWDQDEEYADIEVGKWCKCWRAHRRQQRLSLEGHYTML